MHGRWTDWEAAWEQALYGTGGFVHDGHAPAQHFRTSVHIGTVLAEALLDLLERIDHALGRPETLDLVDLGAGGGELLSAMVATADPALLRRLRPLAVDLRPAPPGWELSWRGRLPEQVVGLVVAHEWLDALPCPVVLHDGNSVRRVQVAPDGTERLGPAAAGADLAWLRRWWPLAPGARAEVGLPRDRAWQQVLHRVRAGACLAVDYGHVRGARPCAGTLPLIAADARSVRGRTAAATSPPTSPWTPWRRWPRVRTPPRREPCAHLALHSRAGRTRGCSTPCGPVSWPNSAIRPAWGDSGGCCTPPTSTLRSSLAPLPPWTAPSPSASAQRRNTSASTRWSTSDRCTRPRTAPTGYG